MEIQSTIHDHTYNAVPEIVNKSQIDLILQAMQNHKSRNDCHGRWIKARNIAMLMVSYHLALRPKEACTIKLADVDLIGGIIKIPPEGNKLKSGRTVPIPKQLVPYLQSYMHFPREQFWKFSPYLFPSLENGHISRDRWTEIFRETLKKAGIYKQPTRGKHGHITPYSLRHTKLTEVYGKTLDPFIVANIAGHKTLESTKVYIHLNAMNKGYLENMRNALSS